MARRNPAAVRQLLRSPAGPVGRDNTRRTVRVANRARVLCPVRHGLLRSSIAWTAPPAPSPRGLTSRVGSNKQYALAVHEGSGSPFAPRSWRIGHARGHVVPARRYLTNALPAAAGP
jgi:hypothetical protein